MGGLMGSKPKSAPLPKVEPPAPMPDPEDPLAKRNQQRNAAQKMATTGRESTLLSQYSNNQTLG